MESLSLMHVLGFIVTLAVLLAAWRVIRPEAFRRFFGRVRAWWNR